MASSTDGAMPENLPPMISILMPVFNPPPEFLERAIQSVVRQTCSSWELCIADDGSSGNDIAQILRRWSLKDRRINVVFSGSNQGISAATNSAAGLATGNYIGFLDQDDELTPEAISQIIDYLRLQPNTDLLYSDEDRIDATGKWVSDHLKPDWSPEMLLSFMYMGHLLVIRSSIFHQLGGLRSEFDGSQDHDLALRATELTKNIGHIRKVLYHWRAIPTSTAYSGHVKPESGFAGQLAIEHALSRRHLTANVYRPEWALTTGSSFYTLRFPDQGRRVAIYLPVKNDIASLRACLESLSKTCYSNYQIVILNNGSDDLQILDYLKSIAHRVLTIPTVDGRYRLPEVYLDAVKETDCDYILFINPDTEVLRPEWLSEMVGYMGVPGVAAVGARLVFPDGRPQNVGTVNVHENSYGHPSYMMAPSIIDGDLVSAMTVRNYASVSSICMITSRELFLRFGTLPVPPLEGEAFNTHYCNWLTQSGFRVVYCPFAELIHYGRYLRGFEEDAVERSQFWLHNDRLPGTSSGDLSGEARSGRQTELVGLQSSGVGTDKAFTIQVFWSTAVGFTEKNSMRLLLAPDGRRRVLRFVLPKGAQGPIRLDPGSGSLYCELYSVLIYEIDTRPGKSSLPRQVASLSTLEEFNRVQAMNDIVVIPCTVCYRFLCIGPDPQLHFNLDLPNRLERSYVFELSLAVSSDLQDPLLKELFESALGDPSTGPKE